MTKEEIVAALLDDMEMPYLQDWQARDIVDFVIKNYKPSLPSNLDEAAEKAVLSVFTGYADLKTPFREEKIGIVKQIFYTGAEWMAGQGVNADFEVCKLANRAWLTPIDEKRFVQDVFDNFTAGDKVVVQIRKK